jgi:hypothetical protein
MKDKTKKRLIETALKLIHDSNPLITYNTQLTGIKWLNKISDEGAKANYFFSF